MSLRWVSIKYYDEIIVPPGHANVQIGADYLDLPSKDSPDVNEELPEDPQLDKSAFSTSKRNSKGFGGRARELSSAVNYRFARATR